MKAYILVRTENNETIAESAEKYGVFKTMDAALEKSAELEPDRYDAFYIVKVTEG